MAVPTEGTTATVWVFGIETPWRVVILLVVFGVWVYAKSKSSGAKCGSVFVADACVKEGKNMLDGGHGYIA